ncbi:hypothetical protein [Phyllobacterium zundukense]|uniref:Uncharacterized protein n=1 Tax=Phyllobacterium zundukense TaxID=1867719 RepID=A0ACD4CZZ3_9HYPH|nr:hypothetical protein [Phyllobacterium zundukense]UXN59099.1 hypothetical protein N8E88_09510 [Phyllobacterium zundukense]
MLRSARKLVPAYDPMQFDTPEDVSRMARHRAVKCAGVWPGLAMQPEMGGYGPSTILFQSGDGLELE